MATVKLLIDQISVQISSENIYITGFSQEACPGLEVVAQFAQQYTGVAAFMGGLIVEVLKPEEYSGNSNGIPVFIGNSDFDPQVPAECSEASAQLMESTGALVIHIVYPAMPHTITTEEIKTVQRLMF